MTLTSSRAVKRAVYSPCSSSTYTAYSHSSLSTIFTNYYIHSSYLLSHTQHPVPLFTLFTLPLGSPSAPLFCTLRDTRVAFFLPNSRRKPNYSSNFSSRYPFQKSRRQESTRFGTRNGNHPQAQVLR